MGIEFKTNILKYINLKDKLKGFVNKKNKNNKRLYNALSNLTCEELERRPKFKEESENEIKPK